MTSCARKIFGAEILVKAEAAFLEDRVLVVLAQFGSPNPAFSPVNLALALITPALLFCTCFSFNHS